MVWFSPFNSKAIQTKRKLEVVSVTLNVVVVRLNSQVGYLPVRVFIMLRRCTGNFVTSEKTVGKSCGIDFLKEKVFFQTNDYSFLESCFGGQLLVLNGYLYRRKSVKAERSYWYCCAKKCPAKGVMFCDGKFQLSDRKHTHEPEFEGIKKKEKRVELKKLALQLNVSGYNLLETLNINEDVEKHLSFIRTCRRRAKKRSPMDVPINVGLDYKRLASRVGSKEMIFHGGYLYREDSKNPLKGYCKYWRCRLKTCKARAKTDELGNLTLLKVRHNHPPEEIETNESVKESASIIPRPLTARTHKGDCSKRVVQKIREVTESAAEEKLKPLIEGTSGLEFPPPETESDPETFSLDKLMAETLADCVTADFADSLLKN